VSSVAQSFTGGLISVAGSPITTSGTLALTVAGTSGGIPYFASASTWATSAALAANALVLGGGAGAAPATTTTGTGVVTALGVNTGTAGAFVVNGGALGTPSSGTVTNLTGTASVNINGTVGATTPTTGAFTTLSASQQITATSGLTIPAYSIDPGTAPAAINIALAAVGGGTATPQYGLKVGGGGFNNSTAVYGVYSSMTQQYLSSTYGGYFEASGTYNNDYGIYAKDTHNPNATTFGYGIYISENTSGGASSVGGTYGLYVAQNATTGGSATGIYVNTVAGATTVTPLQVQHAGSDVFKVSTTGAAVTGTLTSTGTISPQQATTAGAPAYVKGAIYFDTTLNKLRVGGATAWETITSV
jgi:hypothetical protein